MANDIGSHETLPESATELAAMADPSSLGDHLDFTVFVGMIKQRRESLGLTISEVAQRMGVDHAAVSRLESGKQSNPTVNTVMRYVEAIGSRVTWGLADREDETPTPRGDERERRRIRSQFTN